MFNQLTRSCLLKLIFNLQRNFIFLFSSYFLIRYKEIYPKTPLSLFTFDKNKETMSIMNEVMNQKRGKANAKGEGKKKLSPSKF